MASQERFIFRKFQIVDLPTLSSTLHHCHCFFLSVAEMLSGLVLLLFLHLYYCAVLVGINPCSPFRQGLRRHLWSCREACFRKDACGKIDDILHVSTHSTYNFPTCLNIEQLKQSNMIAPSIEAHSSQCFSTRFGKTDSLSFYNM